LALLPKSDLSNKADLESLWSYCKEFGLGNG